MSFTPWKVGDLAIYVAGSPAWKDYIGRTVTVIHVGQDREGNPCATIQRPDDLTAIPVSADERNRNIRPVPPLPSVDLLSTTFANILRSRLTTEQWDAMIERNRNETNPNICASHDFCDANVYMAEAFEILGTTVDVDDDRHTDLWNAAWNRAKPTLAGSVRYRASEVFDVVDRALSVIREDENAEEHFELIGALVRLSDALATISHAGDDLLIDIPLV